MIRFVDILQDGDGSLMVEDSIGVDVLYDEITLSVLWSSVSRRDEAGKFCHFTAHHFRSKA